VSELVEKLFAIHDALAEASLAHAFGGGIALAYCADEPRITREIDLKIFTEPDNVDRVVAALPFEVDLTSDEIESLRNKGRVLVRWDGVPVDLFFNNHPFVGKAAESVVWVSLADREVPVVDCASLVVFKAMFDRTKDWADIEAVAERTPAQVEAAAEAVAELVGEDDPACERLAAIVGAG
jgi:nucleotidyltransferase AbiEii toxin of type IV toxin-antitoxin system